MKQAVWDLLLNGLGAGGQISGAIDETRLALSG